MVDYRLLPAVLVIAGLLLVGGGTAAHLDARTERVGATVVVDPAPNASDAAPLAERPARERRIVRQAIEADAPVLVRRPPPDPGNVTYEGATYRVRTYAADAGPLYHPLYVLAPWGLGGLLLASGAALGMVFSRRAENEGA